MSRRKPTSPYYGSKIKCLGCNAVIQSKHHHDFVRCKCKGDRGIFVDGGASYLRMGYYEGAKWEVVQEGNYRDR